MGKQLKTTNLSLKLVSYCLVLIFLNSSFLNKCYGKTYKIGANKITLNIPEGWQEAANFPHSDVTLFGPFENKRRPIISVERIPLEQYKIKKEDMQKDEKKFREGRMAWVNKYKGKVLKFKKYQVVSWPNIKEVHSIGYRYSMLGNIREEMYYFLTCNGTVFNLMTLATKEELQKHSATIEKTLKSFSCK